MLNSKYCMTSNEKQERFRAKFNNESNNKDNIDRDQSNINDRREENNLRIFSNYRTKHLIEWNSLVETRDGFYIQPGNISNKYEENSMYILNMETNTLISIIRDCYFDFGLWTEADQYFESLLKKFGSFEKPLEILSNITNNNLDDEHILEGVLHILSEYDYEEIEPFGITISIACAVNHSPIIQDLLIACFENWDSADGIQVLEGLQIDDSWLVEYKNNVLNKLKEQCQSEGRY